jgi:glutamyl-tRNA reductase
MKIKDIESFKTAEEVREEAIDWQHWQSNRSMSWLQTCNWSEYFYELAKKFDLIEEFKENGII